MAFASLKEEFEDRDCVLLGGSTDNELCKLAWRQAHSDLAALNHWSFGDSIGSLVDALGVRRMKASPCARPSSSSPTT